MNDRLGDLFGDDEEAPSWALEGGGGGGGGGGSAPVVSPPHNTPSFEVGAGKNANPFEGDDDDIEWGEPSKPSEAQQQKQQQQTKFMESFFQDVEGIKSDIDAIRSATKKVGEINEEALLATSSSKEEQLSNQLKPLIDQTNKRAKRTKNLLALLKDENQKLKAEPTVKASDMRIRENLCITLTRKFIDEMKSYQNAQQKYKADIKKKVKRQVQIVQPDATDEDIDNVIRSDGGREAVFKGAILETGRVNDRIKNTYAKVAGKYQDVLTLEASVAELHQMFLDFALLTEQQGELLDQIEFQVSTAAEYVEEANEEVVEAIEISKKTRKKQCIIIGIVLVLALAAAGWVISILP